MEQVIINNNTLVGLKILMGKNFNKEQVWENFFSISDMLVDYWKVEMLSPNGEKKIYRWKTDVFNSNPSITMHSNEKKFSKIRFTAMDEEKNVRLKAFTHEEFEKILSHIPFEHRNKLPQELENLISEFANVQQNEKMMRLPLVNFKGLRTWYLNENGYISAFSFFIFNSIISSILNVNLYYEIINISTFLENISTSLLQHIPDTEILEDDIILQNRFSKSFFIYDSNGIPKFFVDNFYNLVYNLNEPIYTDLNNREKIWVKNNMLKIYYYKFIHDRNKKIFIETPNELKQLEQRDENNVQHISRVVFLLGDGTPVLFRWGQIDSNDFLSQDFSYEEIVQLNSEFQNLTQENITIDTSIFTSITDLTEQIMEQF